MLVGLLVLFASAFLVATEPPDPPQGCKWQDIAEIKVSIALPEGWRFRELPKNGSTLAYEVVPAGGAVPAKTASRYELRFQRLERIENTVGRARDHVQNAVAPAVESTPLEESKIGVVTLFAAVGQLSPDASGNPQLIVAVSALANERTGALYTIRFEIPTSEAEAVLPLGNMLFRAIRVDDEI